MKRRELIQTAFATSAALGILAEAKEEPPWEVIDSNVSLFRWPFRRLPLDETDLLVEKLRSLGIRQAFAGSFEGVFHRDISEVNRRLAETCLSIPELIPFGSVNPTLPGWERDLEVCSKEYGMPGVRLHPNYHGYSLDDVRFRDLLALAAEAGLLVQLVATVEDVRTQNSVATVPEVNLAPLPKLVATVPGARVQILNWRPRRAELESIREVSGILFDTARVDATDGIELLQGVVSPDRVLFGSHSPFLIPEAALIRLMHESVLEEASLRKIAKTNAEQLMGDRLR